MKAQYTIKADQLFNARSAKQTQRWMEGGKTQSQIDSALVRAAQLGHVQAVEILMQTASPVAIEEAKLHARSNGKMNTAEVLGVPSDEVAMVRG